MLRGTITSYTITQRRGVITLIPKKVEQSNLQNMRPICLLDVIYKIVAKVIAMRINSVIRKLVSNAQTGVDIHIGEEPEAYEWGN